MALDGQMLQIRKQSGPRPVPAPPAPPSRAATNKSRTSCHLMLMDSMPTKSLLYLGCDKAVLSGCEGAAAEVNVKPPPSSLSSSSAEGGMELEPSSSSNSTSSSPTPPPSSGTAASSLDILSGAAETIDRNAISNSSDLGLSCGGGDDSSVANAKEEVEGGGGGNANGSSSSALATTTSVLVLDGAAAAAVATTTCTYTDTNAGDNTSASTAFERMPGGNDADTGGDDDVPSTSSNAIASNDNNSASTDGSPSRYEYTYIDNNDGNIVLSYHFLPYKELMYQAFRDLGLHAPREVESSVVEKVMHAFQGGSEPLAGRRFLKHLYRSKDSQCVAVTNDVALEKIRRDIYQRKETSKLWLDSDDKISKSTRAKTTLSKKNSSPAVRQPSRRSRKGEDKSEGRPKRVRSVTMPGGGENEVQKTSRRTSEQPKVTGTLSCNSQEQNTIHVDTEFTAAVLVGRRRRMEELLTGLPDTPNVNCYEEESAWRFYNPEFPEVETMSSKKGLSPEKLTELRGGIALSPLSVPISPDELPPLPPAAPLPPLPDTEFCDWSFDEESRVLLADFRVPSRRKMEGEGERFEVKVVREDEIFLLTMMERDDITVISQGLADEINSSIWSREYIESVIGSVYHHKFRGFQTMFREDGTISEQTMEKEGWYSMKFSDYFKYLEQRCSVKSNLLDTKDFTFIDSYGTTTTVDVDNEALYMVDVDVVKLLPDAFDDLQQNFKLSGILPGGSHCMMSAVNASGRPFMGPNLYLTPPASFTHFHQDGHGTVDSGHLCLSGYNEVVMLRRLTERHKCHAIQLLTGSSTFRGTLYGLPHRDGLKSQPGWPNNEAIEQCKKMGYCPSVFILKPGQVVHINKGRLHAFRKMAPSKLPETDCHHALRNIIVSSKEEPTGYMCCSLAWDWMFKGVTSDGINREVSSILECSRLNRQHELQSLAIPETTLLFLAKKNIALHKVSAGPISAFLPFSTSSHANDRFAPDAMTVLRGILPSLQYVVKRHSSSVAQCKQWAEETKLAKDSWRVSIDSKPNTWQDPNSFALDPYGAGDFFCMFCSEELSNVYMHCDGCEKLLSKDFNICSGCHAEGRYQVFHQMHPFNDKRISVLNHTGNKTNLRQAKCPCRNGKECGYCSYCTGCSCRCHQRFTVHYRFMGLDDELGVLEMVENVVGSNTIPQSAETIARLFSLITPSGATALLSKPETIDLCSEIS